MKVLMFGWEFPPHISGGLGTACLGLTKHLAKLGAEITFVLPKVKGDYSTAPVRIVGPSAALPEITKQEKELDVEHLIKQYKVNSSLHPYFNQETYIEYMSQLERIQQTQSPTEQITKLSDWLDLTGGYGPNLFSEVSRYAAAGQYIAKLESFDVIHAHDWMTYQAGVLAKHATGKPLIVHVHATEFDRSSNVNSDIYSIEKYGMDNADRIMAVSKRTRDIVIEKYHQHPDKVTVIYNAVEKEDMDEVNQILAQSAFSNDKIVLFLGRITSQKGPEYFVEAANAVLSKMENVRFVMAGAGDMTKQMIEQIAIYRIADRFHFTGFLNAEQRERLFSMSDLFVMPSVSEPFGITPLEAMKHNIPVIISKQSGIAEILDHVIKVDFWDVKKLSKAIVEILSNPEHTNKMVHANNETLQAINWENSAKDVLTVYQNLANR